MKRTSVNYEITSRSQIYISGKEKAKKKTEERVANFIQI